MSNAKMQARTIVLLEATSLRYPDSSPVKEV
jgi:hypothetical protein